MNLRNIRLGNRPLTIGLIFGVIFALALILYGYILAPVLGQFDSYIQLALPVIFGLLAGRRASIRTGKISSGLIAGLLTGAVGSLLTAIITMITVFISLDTIRQQAQLSANKQHPIVLVTNGDIIQYYIQALAFTLIFTILLSIAGGTLGGFLGKGRARLAPAVEEYRKRLLLRLRRRCKKMMRRRRPRTAAMECGAALLRDAVAMRVAIGV